MNILISAIGSMSSEAVISSLRKIDGVKLVGCDIYDKEWIYPSELVDSFYQVPRSDSPDFIDKLLDICLWENIQYIVPLTDLEVDALSVNREVFEEKGITLCISSDEVVQICRNKKTFVDYLSGVEGLHLLPTYTFGMLPDSWEGSMIAKPQRGRSSEGVVIIDEYHQITFIKDKEKDRYIFQPLLSGVVVTVDIVCDSFGNSFFISREELIRTKNGAGLTVRLFNNEQLTKTIRAVLSRLSILGCVNMEFFYDGESYYLMDINPRFSAGIAFSQLAGYDFVRNHINVFSGGRIDPGIDYESRVMRKRYVEFA